MHSNKLINFFQILGVLGSDLCVGSYLCAREISDQSRNTSTYKRYNMQLEEAQVAKLCQFISVFLYPPYLVPL